MNRKQLPERAVATWPINDLIPYARNARTHSAEQIAQLAASIKEFGINNPILVGQKETSSPAMPECSRRADPAVQIFLAKYRRLGRRLNHVFIKLLRGTV